ncbi:MAG TPA: hypothetical protein VLJ37_11235 [bacterium]|nr:hypothetical protein [bacterium]
MVSQPSDPMMTIWEKVSVPQAGGMRCIVWRNRNDLDYLYDSGFVDTDQYRKEQWIDAFQDSLKPDGSYIVTKDQWLAKRAFRFDGPTGEPFDPLTLPEGEWDMDAFDKLLKQKILPSTTLTEENFRRGFEKARKTAIVNGKVVVNKMFKFNLKQIFLLYPSPRRNREMAVAEERMKLTPPKADKTSKAATGLSQASGFSTGPSKEQSIQDRLSRLLKKG